MLVSATLPGAFNPEWNAEDGRKGRKAHALGPDFTPMDLGNDLLAWWDPQTLTTGDVSAWEDRKNGAGLIAGGTGTPTFDGEMLVIPSTAFLFGPQVWSFAYPVEIWQVVDQQEAAGSANATSFAYGAGPSSVSLVYTPPIGGQSSAIINGQTIFGGDDYHGVHVIRWTFGPNWSLGYLDRRYGQSSTLVPAAPLEPADVYLGANQQGADLWKGRIGDTVVTKGGLSSGEVNAMWDFMMSRRPSAGAPPRSFTLDAGVNAQSGDSGYYRTIYGSISQEPLDGEQLIEFATRTGDYFQAAFEGDVLAKIEGWVPQIDGINIGTLSSDWAFDGSNTSATWTGGDTMASNSQYSVTWARK